MKFDRNQLKESAIIRRTVTIICAIKFKKINYVEDILIMKDVFQILEGNAYGNFYYSVFFISKETFWKNEK